MTTQDTERSERQAEAQLRSIIELVAALNDAKFERDREVAEQDIQDDALSVEVRSDWYEVGADPDDPSEYRIVLCTGGPAVQIIGKLGRWNQPDTAHLEHQDWGTPWINFPLTSEQEEQVLEYVRCFYFGE